MNVRRFFSFRSRVAVIVAGILLGGAVALLHQQHGARLREKEQHDVALWAHVMERVTRDVTHPANTGAMADPLVADIMSTNNNIPFIITNERLEVSSFHLVPDRIMTTPTCCAGNSTVSRKRTPRCRCGSGGRTTTI